MRTQFSRVLLLTLALLVAAGTAAAQKPRGDRNRLTKDDIADGAPSVATAYEAVRLLRPQWLQPPMSRAAASNLNGGTGGATEVVLYVDDMRMPSLEELRAVKIADIVEMKFLDQNRAIILRGPGHEAGALEVTTIHKRK